MKYFDRKTILQYLYDQLTGNFAGFLIGLSATSLVSQFFETRSFKNLWGLTSKKTVVDKDTFSNLEWIIAIVIGFIVFEIVTKVLKERLGKWVPQLRLKLFRFVIQHDLKAKLKNLATFLHNKRMVFFSGLFGSVRNTLAKYSKR